MKNFIKDVFFRISMLGSCIALLIIPLLVIFWCLLLFPLFAVVLLLCNEEDFPVLLERYRDSFPVINKKNKR